MRCSNKKTLGRRPDSRKKMTDFFDKFPYRVLKNEYGGLLCSEKRRETGTRVPECTVRQTIFIPGQDVPPLKKEKYDIYLKNMCEKNDVFRVRLFQNF